MTAGTMSGVDCLACEPRCCLREMMFMWVLMDCNASATRLCVALLTPDSPEGCTQSSSQTTG